MIRDTAAQDRVIENRSLLQRHWRVLLIVGLIGIGMLWLLPLLLRMTGVTHSVAATRLNIATVTRSNLVRDIAADGKIVAAVSPTLYAPSSGSVTLKAHAGDTVTREQILATIDSPELSARLAQEHASLQSQQLDTRRAQLDADRQLLQAQETFHQAEVDQKTAERELDRSRKAHELGAYSELQVLRAQDALEKANFVLQQAKTNLAAQPAQNRFEVDSKRALADRQQALVNDLQRQIDALNLRSPVDGQVGQVQIADRATVAKDAPLLSVVDLSALEVEIQVPEGFARDLAVNMPAELSGNGGHWSGSVSAVSPEVVAGQVVARVRFGKDKPEGLRQNQRLSVRILIDSRENVLTLSRGSFVDQDGGGYAYVVHDDIAEKHPVRLGATSIEKVEVLEGLKEGDAVVVSGTEAFNGAERVAISR